MKSAARANGLDAIDGPWGDFKDGDGYKRKGGWASTLGAVGKWCIHPSQIDLANEASSPTEREVARAKEVVAAVEAAAGGAANLNGTMIDAATARVP